MAQSLISLSKLLKQQWSNRHTLYLFIDNIARQLCLQKCHVLLGKNYGVTNYILLFQLLSFSVYYCSAETIKENLICNFAFLGYYCV